MPFEKVGPNEYKSPSGRKFTKKQVGLYHATEGFKNVPQKLAKRQVRRKTA